jgi:hypothetical protein
MPLNTHLNRKFKFISNSSLSNEKNLLKINTTTQKILYQFEIIMTKTFVVSGSDCRLLSFVEETTILHSIADCRMTRIN